MQFDAHEAQHAAPAPPGFAPPPQQAYPPQFAAAPPLAPALPVAPPRARTILIACTALLSELVIIVGTNNQSVTDWVVRKTAGHGNSFLANVALSSQSFRWRINSQIGDALAADFVRDGVLIGLTALLVAAVVRGAVTASRAFWGTWMAVVFAAEIGAVVSVFVVPADKLPAGHTAAQRLFFANPYAPNAYLLVGALGLGLIVAAITAVIAITTRRSAGFPALPAPFAAVVAGEGPAMGWPAPIAVPEPPPWTPAPSYNQPPSWTHESTETIEPTTRLPTIDEPARSAAAGGETAALPRWGEDETVVVQWGNETAELPRWEAPAEAQTTALPSIDRGAEVTGAEVAHGRHAAEPDNGVVRIDEGPGDGDDDEDDDLSSSPDERRH